jgi:hypothetical protein
MLGSMPRLGQMEPFRRRFSVANAFFFTSLIIGLVPFFIAQMSPDCMGGADSQKESPGSSS